MPVSHTITRTVTINGTTYYFSSVRAGENHGRQGETREADDGSSRTTVTGRKKRYVYSLEKSTPALYAALLALPDTFSVTDHNGATWTGEVPIGSPSWTVSYGDPTDNSGTEYTVEVEIRER